MEKQARAIDAQSHRGVAGRTLLELDGDIAFLSSGGGASITCLDALITYGGRPANFAEYSGNPERGRVYQLTKLVLSKRALRGFGSLVRPQTLPMCMKHWAGSWTH